MTLHRTTRPNDQSQLDRDEDVEKKPTVPIANDDEIGKKNYRIYTGFRFLGVHESLISFLSADHPKPDKKRQYHDNHNNNTMKFNESQSRIAN